MRLARQGNDDDLVLSIDVERLTGKTDGHHGAVRINPPTVAISRRSVTIGAAIEGECRASGIFDPVRRKHRRAIDHAVPQNEDAEAAKIPQRDSGAATSDLLPGFGFKRIERGELHAEARPDRLGHVVSQTFPRGHRYQAAEDVSIPGVVIELMAWLMFGFQAPHQRQNASRDPVTERFAVAINVGIPVRVILVPAYTGRHGNQVANGYRVIGAAA